MEGYKFFDIPVISDGRGNLVVVEQCKQIPFEIKRVFWIFGVPESEKRAGHAHKLQKQFIVAVSGSFDVLLDNGYEKVSVTLNNPSKGLLISNGIWLTLEGFSPDAVCLVMVPEIYNPQDYISDYTLFLDWKKNFER